MENWKSWDIAECFGPECEEAMREAAQTPQLWLMLPPYERAGIALARLMRKYRIVIVSYRPEKFYEVTKSWMVLHEIPFDDLILVPARSEKLRVAEQTGCVAFIDDNQSVCEGLRDMGLVVGQTARPWNHGGRGIARSHTLPEVSESVVEMLRGTDQRPRLF